MAISKTYINGDITALYNWLVANASDYFTSFENNTDYVSCYIGEHKALDLYIDLRYSGLGGVKFYTNTGKTLGISGSQNGRVIEWAYKTTTSLAFSSVYSGTSSPFAIVITKDNNNDVSVVVVNAFTPNLSGNNTVYAVSMESESIDSVSLAPNTGKATSALCPLIVSGTTMRYLPNVYYMPFAQYSIEGSFLIDNVVYLCNGIIAVKDEYRG